MEASRQHSGSHAKSVQIVNLQTVSLLRMQAPSPLKAAKISTTPMAMMKVARNRTSTAPMAHQPQWVAESVVPAVVRVVLVAVAAVDAVVVLVDRDADQAAVAAVADRSKL